MDAAALKSRFPNLVLDVVDQKGDSVAYIRKEGIRSAVQTLRDDPETRFDLLLEIFAVDYLHWEEKEKRFEVVYSLYSTEKNHRLFLKVAVSENDPRVDSVVSVWPAADWYERETWDMMGIRFDGHPNLKRILMYEGFEGHALRKDYPYNKRQPLIGPVN